MDSLHLDLLFMATMHKDDYNYYQSQLRMTIECAFGMLVHRWSILRKPMPTGMHLGKVTELTMALCKLHNFCIDEEGGLGKSKQASSGPSSC
jgi:hypothetical protein